MYMNHLFVLDNHEEEINERELANHKYHVHFETNLNKPRHASKISAGAEI